MADKTAEQWNNIPYGSMLKQPITANIPYLYRWKLLQIKLMLQDLQQLQDKHGIENAQHLITLVKKEAADLIDQLWQHIAEKRTIRNKLLKGE